MIKHLYQHKIYKEMHKDKVIVCMSFKEKKGIRIWYCSSCVRRYKWKQKTAV